MLMLVFNWSCEVIAPMVLKTVPRLVLRPHELILIPAPTLGLRVELEIALANHHPAWSVLLVVAVPLVRLLHRSLEQDAAKSD